jgi:acyl carrier protein
MNERIRTILQDYARLGIDVDELTDDSDLYEAGMTSHASVNVMLALEDEFDIEFPDRFLRRDVFATVGSIHDGISEILATRDQVPTAR